MNVITVAIGERFVALAATLKQAIPNLIVIAEGDIKPEHQHADPAIAARLVKTALTDYLPENASGPVLFLDADLQPGVPDPIAELPAITSDVAGVQWSRQVSSSSYGGNVENFNSGLVLFRSVEIAHQVCVEWRKLFASNHRNPRSDEPQLRAVLGKLNLTVELLEPKFNAKEPGDGVVFIHTNFSAANKPPPTKEEAFKSGIKAGFDTGMGFRLALGDKDRADFTGMTVLVQTALSAGLITTATEETISDKDGVIHTVTVAQFIGLMLGYGNYYKQLWNTLLG